MSSVCNLVQVRAGDLSEGFPSSEQESLSLNENWARTCSSAVSSLCFVVGHMIDWIILFKIRSMWICLKYLIVWVGINEFGMSLVWNIWMVGYVYWYDAWELYDCWWNMNKVWVGRNSMTLLVRVYGGASSNGRNSMNLVVRVHGGASSNGCNSMNLVVRVHSGASSNGRNSMNLVVRVVELIDKLILLVTHLKYYDGPNCDLIKI